MKNAVLTLIVCCIVLATCAWSRIDLLAWTLGAEREEEEVVDVEDQE